MKKILAATCIAIALSGCEDAKRVQELSRQVQETKEEVKQVRQQAEIAQQKVAELTKDKDKALGAVSSVLWIAGVCTLALILYRPARNIILRTVFRLLPYKARRFDGGTK